jgi:hypothetical protein
MKRNTLLVLLTGMLFAGVSLTPAYAGKGKNNRGGGTVPQLSQAEANDLAFMREEEKLARDVYITLYDEWNLRVFSNISASEQRHTDAVLGLLVKYGLPDPTVDFGHFTNPDLQALYDNLVATGLLSELDALMVGALIEEVDMEDIVVAMERTDEADILTVYGNLLAGSENHLQAFVRNIEAITGEAYVAQWLSQAEVDAILGR